MKEVFHMRTERARDQGSERVAGRVLDSQDPLTLIPTWGEVASGTCPHQRAPFFTLPDPTPRPVPSLGARVSAPAQGAEWRHSGLASERPCPPAGAGGDPGSRFPGSGGPRPRLPAPRP